MPNSEKKMIAAIDGLDAAIFALRSVSALNQLSADFNADLFATARDALETAAKDLAECDRPDLVDAIRITLPRPKTWMILRGLRLIEKIRAGRTILRLRKTRDLIASEVDTNQVPSLTPWRWHDAEGLVRIGLHPVTLLIILVWNVLWIVSWMGRW